MNNEIVEEKKNNTNKILIAIIIILLLALGELSYYTFFVRDKEVDKNNPVVEPTSSIDNDITATEAKKYYDYVKADLSLLYYDDNKMYSKLIYSSNWNSNKNNYEYVVKTELDDNTKAYLAYRLLQETDLKNESCSKYKDIDNNNKEAWCGSDLFNMLNEINSGTFDEWNENNKTEVFDLKSFENKYELLFGKDSYVENDNFCIQMMGRANYCYSKSQNQFVLSTYPVAGGAGPIPESTLISYKKVDDTIVLVEKIEFVVELEEITKTSQNLQHIFKKSDDGNYYYESTKEI